MCQFSHPQFDFLEFSRRNRDRNRSQREREGFWEYNERREDTYRERRDNNNVRGDRRDNRGDRRINSERSYYRLGADRGREEEQDRRRAPVMGRYNSGGERRW